MIYFPLYFILLTLSIKLREIYNVNIFLDKLFLQNIKKLNPISLINTCKK